MRRREFIKRGALFVPTIFIPRLIRAQSTLTAEGLAAYIAPASGGGGGGGGGSFTLINHQIAFNQISGTATNAGFDTTGAALITIYLGYVNAPSLVDNKGNTLTPLTIRNDSGQRFGRMYYCINPGSVGAGHTWSAQGTNSYPMFWVAAWSYSASTPLFDNENGNNAATGTSISTGAGSSTGGTPLVIAGTTWNDTGSTISAVSNSFTLSDQSRNGGTNIGIAGAYLIQSGGGASVNPSFTITGGAEANLVGAIMAFK